MINICYCNEYIFYCAALCVCSLTSTVKSEAPFKYHNEREPDSDFIHGRLVDPSLKM